VNLLVKFSVFVGVFRLKANFGRNSFKQRMAAIIVVGVVACCCNLFSTSAYGVDKEQHKRVVYRDYGDLSWQLSRDIDGINFKIEFSGEKVDAAKIFYLPKPERLVLDFPSRESQYWSDLVELQKNEIFSKVRVASHSQKIRIVFDLTKNLADQYQVVRAKNSLVVKIQNLTEQLSKSKAIDLVQKHKFTPTLVAPDPTLRPLPSLASTRPKATPTASPIPTIKPSPTVIQKLTPTTVGTPTLNVEVTPTKVSTTASEGDLVSDDILRLSKIRFDAAEEDETLKGVLLSFNKPTDYQIRRKAKDLFIVIVKDANLSDQSLALPHFPPNNFFGFVSIRAQQSGKDILIYIYVEDGIHLMSYPLENDVRLQVVKD
jgi:AMIN domain